MNKQLKSKISHDKASNRIYLMSLHPDDFPEIIRYLDDLADQSGYTKIFGKIPVQFLPLFVNSNYIIEAGIPHFFNGIYDVVFVAKYKSANRQVPDHESLEAFQDMLINQATPKQISLLQDNFNIRSLYDEDVDEMIPVFKQVFKSYPFPIFEKEFILKSMLEDGTRYFGAFSEGKLVAISSAECDNKEKNAEMTDFAVLPQYRGNRLAVHLLRSMEKELTETGFKTFYTICRLKSLSMNKTFLNLGYTYSGTLTQNTHISGTIESMNVWYKSFS